MGKRKYITVEKEVYVDVDVFLDDFYEDDLVSELESRGYEVRLKIKNPMGVQTLYDKQKIEILNELFLKCDLKKLEEILNAI